jgi:DNA-binding FadR family transcriptional regulator
MTSSPSPDSATDPAKNDPLEAVPPARPRVADHVFETLAKAILAGRFKPGEPLPTQRALATQFNISALVVRQAIHRLEELGLVRVRQGSSTIVLDPQESADIRLIQLRLELSAPEPALHRAVLGEQLAVLEYIVNALDESAATGDTRRFRIEYWVQIAEAAGNPMYQQQIRWWRSMTKQLRDRRLDVESFDARVVAGVYRRINQALAEHRGAVEVYLKSIEPQLVAHERQQAATAAAKSGR